MAGDLVGNAYIAAASDSSNFPTTPGAFQPAFAGGGTQRDAVVTKLNANGSALSYSTYLGGTGSDWADAIAVDAAGNAYITGSTTSPNFPITPGAFRVGGLGAFVTKFDATGSFLLYSTQFASNGSGSAIAVDGRGNAYVTGVAGDGFRTTPDALQPTPGGPGNDAFLTIFDCAGTTRYATFLGGSDTDYGYGIAVDGGGNAYVVGMTASANFPTTVGAFQPVHGGPYGGGGAYNGFVAKFADVAPPSP